ncbi:MAG: transcription elongation factor subunit Spt4 [Thermoprotei archaeon]|nr:transcription elongation factor subunit Spt4 [Thermoprotei archaeon]
MPARKAPSKKPPFKACRDCGVLNPREATICSNCGSSNLLESWEGMVIILSADSVLASKLGINKPVAKAIRISGKIVTK